MTTFRPNRTVRANAVSLVAGHKLRYNVESGSVSLCWGEPMKAYLAIVSGLALLLAPLWSLSGFVTAPQYRTGTIADYDNAIIAAATLYGGVLAGVLIGRRYQSKQNGPGLFRPTFKAGMVGAMGAITIALLISFVGDLVSTGRLLPPGQTPALLPMFYVVGGVLSAFMAAGAGLIAYGLSGANGDNRG